MMLSILDFFSSFIAFAILINPGKSQRICQSFEQIN